MTLDEIHEQWAKDCIIDETELGRESLKIPKLHAKYTKLWSSYGLKLHKLREQRKVLLAAKHRLYAGTIDRGELEHYGWQPYDGIIPRADISVYIDGDNDVVELNLKIAYLEEVCKVLESIGKSISTRNFVIKNSIEFNKFLNGQM